MNLARFSINRPVTTVMFYLAIILMGAVSLSQLSVDLLPSISYPRLSVITQYPGVAPEEIEKLVTIPLETSLSRIPGLRKVESVSKEGFSFITVEFSWGTNMDFALLHVRERLDSARDTLPEGCDKPLIIALDPQSQPIMTLALTGEQRLIELKELAEELIKPRLEQIDGLAAVEITGGVEREIQVEIDPEKLATFGLQIDEVTQKIAAFNRSLQGGIIRKGKFIYSLRISGEFEQIKDIENIPVRFTGDRGLILVKHLGRVVDTIKEREGTTRLNGRESIGLLVRKEYGANTVKVTKAARKIIEDIKRENPGINLEIISEQADYIQEAISTAKEEVIEGAILAFLVLLIFLQEWRAPLVIATVIPISIIGAFNLLFLRKITLNLMSLGGLALGVGMLDDTAVVVSENIHRHKQQGKSLKLAAEAGTNEVMNAITASILTTIVVFLPVIYVKGIAGQLFKDAALTVTFTLLSALLVSITLLPMLDSREFSRPDTPVTSHRFKMLSPESIRQNLKKKNFLFYPWVWFKFIIYNLLNLIIFVLVTIAREVFGFLRRLFSYIFRPFKSPVSRIFRSFNRQYERFVRKHYRLLSWSLENKRHVFILSLIFFALVFVLGTRLPRELMPPLRTSTFVINLKAPEEFSFEQTEEFVARLELWLQQKPGCRRIFSQVGVISSTEAVRPEISVNSAEITVDIDYSRHLEDLMAETRKYLAGFPGLQFSVSRAQNILAEFLALAPGVINLKVKGQDLDRLREVGLDFASRLKTLPGLADVNLNLQQGKPQLLLEINQQALEKYPGLSPSQVAGFLVQATRGQVATSFREMEKKYDVRVVFESEDRRSVEAILNSFLPSGNSLIPVREIVNFRVLKGPNEIRRENQEREIIITASIRGKKISQVLPDIQKLIQKTGLPAGYRIIFGGEREEMARSFRSLLLAFLMAMVLIYMIMAAQFESLLHPLLIMFTVPMGLVGAILILFLTGQSINAISIIGAIVLIGVVVDNAIVEIDYINQLRRQGHQLRPAVLEGSQVRLRPIMMSTLSTVAGLIPMALGLGRGAELLRPLALTVIGGLISSLFLTLILIPDLYEYVEARKIKNKENMIV